MDEDEKKINLVGYEYTMWKENLYSLLGIAIAMGVISFTNCYFHSLLLIPALASSAIMLFMSYDNVFAQPRNVVGGHLVAALAAIVVGQFFGNQWWAITLVVVLAAFLMIITRTIHPPSGGTALAVYIGSYMPSVVISSIILDTVIIVLVAFLVNNAVPNRSYPRFWI